MNCASRVVPHIEDRPDRVAVWTERSGVVSFGELGAMAAGTQKAARSDRLKVGVPVLLLDAPGPRLFAAITGLIGLGIPVLVVEPWLPVDDIDHVIKLARPQAFVGGTLAMLWGARVGAIRRIPRWRHIRSYTRSTSASEFAADDVEPSTPAVITFTSGTTGRPKGIVRTHRYMWDVHEILTDEGRRDPFDGPDLCVFPNLALLHLGTGRGAIVVPTKWDDRSLRTIDELPPELQPRSLTCGPAFLLRLLDANGGQLRLAGLSSITVGGALTDCNIIERAMERWDGSDWTHVYGGTEAEPVAHADARVAVQRSRSHGRFQMLYIGAPIPQLEARNSPQGLWVSGPNVAPPYLGDHPDNATVKQIDDQGRAWHCMGDRIVADVDGWWYGGRATQPEGDFDLEQRIYTFLDTSKCFVHRDAHGKAVLYGDGIVRRAAHSTDSFASVFPEITALRDLKIVRDRRHRARIDRRASIAKAGFDHG